MDGCESPNELTFSRGPIAAAGDVPARADAADAPFGGSDELRAWVTRCLEELA